MFAVTSRERPPQKTYTPGSNVRTVPPACGSCGDVPGCQCPPMTAGGRLGPGVQFTGGGGGWAESINALYGSAIAELTTVHGGLAGKLAHVPGALTKTGPKGSIGFLTFVVHALSAVEP